jgi:hypothetical protein
MYVTPHGGIRSPRPYTGRNPGIGAPKHFTGSLVHGGDEGEVVDVQNHSKMLTALVMLVSRDVVRLENQVEVKWIEGNRKPTNEGNYVDVKRAFKEQNTKRAEEREQMNKKDAVDLRVPSRETVRPAINNLDQFQYTLVRGGLEAPQKKLYAVARDPELTLHLQRVEIDLCTVDLVAMMANSGMMPLSAWATTRRTSRLQLPSPSVAKRYHPAPSQSVTIGKPIVRAAAFPGLRKRTEVSSTRPS